MPSKISEGINYAELNRATREIRLLRILPCGGPQYAWLPCCQTLQVSLEHAPRYLALSYAWGCAEQNRVIIVNNLGLRIPKNLYEALLALRPSRSSFLLWVDYICINQKNEAEKAWQVGMMRDIYARADRVLAWMGPGDPKSKNVVQYLNKIGEEADLCGFQHVRNIGDVRVWEHLAKLYASRSGDSSLGSIAERLKTMLFAAAFDYHLFPGTHSSVPQFERLALSGQNLRRKRLKLLVRLVRLIDLFHKINGWSCDGTLFPLRDMSSALRRPWFGRIWVLQEIAVSKRATFIYGTERIELRRFRAALNALNCLREAMRARYKANDGGWLTPYHCELAFGDFFFQASTLTNSPMITQMAVCPLIALLRLTCVGSPNLRKHGPHHLHSSDPRDKIFALLGLATDREDLEERGFTPDYGKSCQEVYTHATSVMLQQGHLSLLSYVQPRHKSDFGNLPSWVPDWYQPITEPFQITPSDHMTLQPTFSACGMQSVEPEVEVNRNGCGNNIISLKGYIYCDVHDIASFPKRVSTWVIPPDQELSWVEEWFVEILRLTYHDKTAFGSFEERLQAVARASIGGVRQDAMSDNVRTDEGLDAEAEHLLRLSIRRIGDEGIRREARHFLGCTRQGNTIRHAELPWTGLIAHITGRSLKRVPFVTTTGRPGLGYDNIRPGDVVAILKGSQVPHILRPLRNGRFNLISEAYVDGIMDGETVPDATFRWLDLM
ncbi:HET-domain-containing protein [Nemania sp. NC0429]|nr:HET-domain-containing protein [Nemania sp. NC0429]